MLFLQSNFDLLAQLQVLVNSFFAKLPNFLGAIILFIVGWLVAKLIASLTRKFFRKLKVDVLAEKLNEIEIVEKANIKIVPSKILSKVIYYVVFLIFIIAGTDVLGMPEVSNLVSNVINYIPTLISALLFLVIGLLLCDFLRKAILTTCKSLGIPSASMISSFVFYFLLINVILVTLQQAGIDTEFIAANISIILGGVVLAFGLGYGLASRSIFSNMLASFYDKDKFKVGDTITYSGRTGSVVDITRSSIILKTEKGKLIVPLHKISQEEIELHD